MDFHEKEERPIPPPGLHSRKTSTLDLGSRPSTASLFNGPTPPLTPNAAANEQFFAQFSIESQKLHFAKPGDPRSLARSDAHVPEWGQQAIFNQPKSRAGPLPSNDIRQFAKDYEKFGLKKKNARKSPPASRPSRNASVERGYESKTWTVEPAIQGNGGLTNAMRAARSEETAADVTWVGTVGFPTDALPETIKEDIYDKLLNEYQAHAVYVSDKDLDGHYAHFCKTILWPIMHYQVPDHPKSKAYADHSWQYYVSVNQAFADKTIASYKKGDVIWVHDYHLLLVPAMIRKKLPDAQIGFFLHTAFPSSEVFRCLSTRNELLNGMLGANLVAFQTQEYAEHFLQTCSRLLTVETTAQGVQLEDHFVNVKSEPIGIDPAATEEERQEQEVANWVKVIQDRYKGKHIIVARDKLDNVRGVRQKLLAYELFLNKYPEWREKVVLIQVATSSTPQSELMTTVSDICTRIDSVHSTLAHQPLVFLKQYIAFSQYLALLTVADVLVISSLRDGMNLTAHEYIFCQDGKGSDKKHGPLVLSEFTGSAAVFGGYQISINPWDYQQQAKAYKQALEMSAEEKANRWSHLHDVVLRQTGGHWAKELCKSLTKVYEEHNLRDSTAIPRLSAAQLGDKYKAANKRLFVLDYEGTLAPHRTDTGIPLSTPERILDALKELVSDPKNIIYVMSGRKYEELETIFRTVPYLGLIAENGCFMREFGAPKDDWRAFANMDEMAKWKSDVKGILQYYLERLEGGAIEERHCSLLFRYDKAEDQAAADRQAGETADHINGACHKMNVHAVPISKAILVETLDYSKASAASLIFNELRAGGQQRANEPDFLMVAGDDREDEIIFRWANDLSKRGVVRDVCTVSVGKRNTEAQATLTQGTTGLVTVLQKLAKISTDSMPVDYFSKDPNGSVDAR